MHIVPDIIVFVLIVALAHSLIRDVPALVNLRKWRGLAKEQNRLANDQHDLILRQHKIIAEQHKKYIKLVTSYAELRDEYEAQNQQLRELS